MENRISFLLSEFSGQDDQAENALGRSRIMSHREKYVSLLAKAGLAAGSLCVAIGLLLAVVGCDPKDQPIRAAKSDIRQSSLRAQGKLVPARGVIQIAALPGDRVVELLVSEGQAVRKDQPLVRLQSEELRQRELELAIQKRDEALQQLDAKRRESEIAIDVAELEKDQAKMQLEQAEAQLRVIQGQESLMAEARQQVERWVQLSKDERTKGMVGSLDVQQRRLETEQNQAKFEQSLLMAEQAVALAKLAIRAAEKKLDAAKYSRDIVEELAPTRSLDKQIELLERQSEASRIFAPSAGTILSISIRPGEMVSQFPLMEMADLTAMVCIAEVSDMQVRLVREGQPVAMKSTAFDGAIQGTVERIDRIVGTPELKIPNPLAKSDFRAVPVRIRIADSDAEAASRLVRLQVDVDIEVDPSAMTSAFAESP